MKKIVKLFKVSLSTILVLCMMMGLCTPVSATLIVNGQSEFFEDFEGTTVGDKAPGEWQFMPNAMMVPWFNSTIVESANDPSGSNNKVAKISGSSIYAQISSSSASNTCFEWVPMAYSFKMYFPAGSLGGSAWMYMGGGGQVLTPFKTDGPGSKAYINLGDEGATDIALKYPADYYDSTKAGTDFIVPADKWIDVTFYFQDTSGTSGNFTGQLFVDGVCMMPKTNWTYTNYVSYSGTRAYMFSGANGTSFYLDDVELRSNEENKGFNTEYSTSILGVAPTAAVTSGHTGTGILVENKEVNIKFSGATAGGTYPAGVEARGAGDGAGLTTKRVMDTTTYAGKVSVKAGATELSEGTNYTLVYDDLQNLTIKFNNNLLYDTTYTVELKSGIKNLMGMELAPAIFTFTTEENQGAAVPPVVSISNTNAGKRFLTGEDITFTSVAQSSEVISKVEFYADVVDGECTVTNPLATDESAPYSADLSFAEEGIYDVYAKATDDGGLFDYSSKVRVIVKNSADIEWSILPANDFVMTVSGNLTLSADASTSYGENLGTVSLKLDGAAISNPYIGALSVGTHTLTATVTDSRGESHTSEAVSFEYRPEYIAGSDVRAYNFNSGGADFTAKIGSWFSWVDDCQATYETKDSAHGDSLTFTAGNGSQWKAFQITDMYFCDALSYDYEFLVEDLDAQIVRFGMIGSYNTKIEINNGQIIDSDDNSKVYGTIEANKWYKTNIVIDLMEGKSIVQIGDVQIVRPLTGTVAGAYRLYCDFFYVNGGAAAGKKMYVDNLNINYVNLASRVMEVKNIAADGSASAGNFITTGTKGFEIKFNTLTASHTMNNIKLYDGTTEIPVTLELAASPDATGGRNGWTFYKSVKVIPQSSTFAFEAGKVYTIKVLPGIISCSPTWVSRDDLYSVSSLATYTFDKTATDSDILLTEASIYTGDTPISSAAQIQGNSVRFGVKAQNTTSDEQKMVLIVAGYNGNKLEICNTKPITLSGNAPEAVYYTDSINVSGCDSVKGFIWSDLGTLKPLGLPTGF